MSVTTATSEGPEPSLLSTRTAVDGNEQAAGLLEKLLFHGRQLMEQSIPQQERPTDTSSSRRSKRSAPGKATAGEILATVFDLTPGTKLESIHFIYLFSSVRIAILSVTAMISRYVLAPVLISIIPPILCTLIGVIGVPIGTILAYSSPSHKRLSNPEVADRLLRVWGVSSALHGLFVGTGLAHLSLPSEPFMILTNLVCFAVMFGAQSATRLAYFSAIISFSLITHLSIGWLFGWLTAPYYLLTGAYTLTALMALQLQIDGGLLSCFLLPCVLVLAKSLVYGIYGVPNGSGGYYELI